MNKCTFFIEFDSVSPLFGMGNEELEKILGVEITHSYFKYDNYAKRPIHVINLLSPNNKIEKIINEFEMNNIKEKNLMLRLELSTGISHKKFKYNNKRVEEEFEYDSITSILRSKESYIKYDNDIIKKNSCERLDSKYTDLHNKYVESQVFDMTNRNYYYTSMIMKPSLNINIESVIINCNHCDDYIDDNYLVYGNLIDRNYRSFQVINSITANSTQLDVQTSVKLDTLDRVIKVTEYIENDISTIYFRYNDNNTMKVVATLKNDDGDIVHYSLNLPYYEEIVKFDQNCKTSIPNFYKQVDSLYKLFEMYNTENGEVKIQQAIFSDEFVTPYRRYKLIISKSENDREFYIVSVDGINDSFHLEYIYTDLDGNTKENVIKLFNELKNKYQ